MVKQSTSKPTDCTWLVADEDASKKTLVVVNKFVEWHKSAELNRRIATSLLTKLSFDDEKAAACRSLVKDLEHIVRHLKELPLVIATMMLLSTVLGKRDVSFKEDITGCLEFAKQKLKLKPEKDFPQKVVA